MIRVQLTRQRLCEGSIDDLGVLLTAAFGLNASWHSEARCKDWNGPDELIPTPWQFDPGQKVKIGPKQWLRGSEMIDLALMSCYACPVQSDCATWAVKARARAGTFAMKIIDLKFLESLDEDVALALIEEAAAAGVPLQRAIPAYRMAAEESKAAKLVTAGIAS